MGMILIQYIQLVGTLGVFSEYEYATLAKEKYSTWDIFIVHGLDNFGIGEGCIKRTSMG